jgi:dTDP-4-dehydrorhamnose 3,5-epimerase-like enzyme
MEIKKVASDNRGDVHSFICGSKTHTIVSFEPNIYRGGHYHKTEQWHICLAGTLFVRLIHPQIGKEECHLLTEGMALNIPAGIAHLFKAIDGEAVLAESRTGEYEATEYEPYRALARPK